MSSNPYESERLRGEYLLFHYGQPTEILPYSFGPAGALDFAVRAVTECIDRARLPVNARALDLGCAVGRSSFELARSCPEVIGIDFSHTFIEAANILKVQGRMSYQRTEEGVITTQCDAVVPPGIPRDGVRFDVGDACDLRPDLGQFDVAVLINLVDRLPQPRRCLERLPGLLKAGGQLVIASPYTWLEEYTPRSEWLGGFQRDGQDIHGFDVLRHILEPDFIFERSIELPFLIREHVRKFQWSVSLAGVWLRR